jgi:hypothetical protein
MRRAARWALACYPLAFRRRYGDELAALVEDSPARAADVADLLRGAAAAHLRPQAGLARAVAPEDRLRATLAAVLGCFAVFAVAGLGFAKATEDAPFAAAGRAHALVGAGHAAVTALGLLAGAALALPVAALALAALRAARQDPRLRRPLGAAAGLVAAVAALTAGLVLAAHHGPAHPALPGRAALLLWGVSVLACGIAGALVIRRVLFLLPSPRRPLTAALGLATVATAAMAAVAVATEVYVIALATRARGLAAAPDGPLGTSATVTLALLLAVMLAATVPALVSTARGWRALAAPRRP